MSEGLQKKKKQKQEQQKTLSYSDMWSRIISSISKKIRWAKGSEITCREEKKTTYRIDGRRQFEPAELLLLVGVVGRRSLEEPAEGPQQAVLVVHEEHRIEHLAGQLGW